VPPHFYGEMAKTELGCQVLQEKGHFAEFAQFIRQHSREYEDNDIIMKLKSILWAVVSKYHHLPVSLLTLWDAGSRRCSGGWSTLSGRRRDYTDDLGDSGGVTYPCSSRVCLEMFSLLTHSSFPQNVLYCTRSCFFNIPRR
jgi:hypothetical protein